MSKLKVSLSFILGFICSILLVLISLLVIVKITVYNKSYVLSSLESSKYYDKVYDEIGKDMKNSLLSSGLDESVIDELYNSSDIKNEVKNIIGAIYSGSRFSVDVASVESKLVKNIDKYLEKNNIVLTDKSSLDSYVSSIISVYENEISLYGYLDNYVNKFVKIGTYLEFAIGLFIIIAVAIIVINKYVIKRSFFGISLLSSALMLLYFRYFIFDKIDFKNILIISDAFSDVLRKLILDIDVYITGAVYLFSILGVLVIIISSFKSKSKRKRKLRSS